MNFKKEIGSTDSPCEMPEDDLLGTRRYAEGLAGFITDCQTPMSIAIQGDWGTGKTSVINYVRKALDSTPVKSVYFNTWQYAQFNLSDNLYFSLLTCLLKAMECHDGEGIKKVKETILMAVSLTSNVLLHGNGLSNEDLSRLVKRQDDMAESVTELKKIFTDEVLRFLNNKHLDRMVIFVDDLDRLNPNVAVELLETMKLFMDVERCVFVLAIDYEVVVQGVRQKFGQEGSQAKCRSFFDKIIQLPFHMPVESYNLNKMIENQLPCIEKRYIQHLAPNAKSTIGANPRTFKRLCNSFLLIQRVMSAQNEESLTGQAQAMLFCALCVQMNCPQLHGFLASNEPWYELAPNKRLLDKDEVELSGADVEGFLNHFFEKNAEVDWDGLAEMLTGLDTVLRDLEKDSELARNIFSGVLHISGITSISPQGQAVKTRADAIKISDVEVLGQSQTVSKAAQAIKFTFQTVLKAHPEKLEDCIEQFNILSREERSDSVFRSKVFLDIGDRPLYLGVSTGTTEKLKSLDRLSDICHLKNGDICWKDGNNYIYPCSDNTSV